MKIFDSLGGLITHLVGNRSRLPSWLNRIIDDVAKNPAGIFARIADSILMKSETVPIPTPVPSGSRTVFIGPTNYAGQGYAWSQSLERFGTPARNLEIVLPGGFEFPADSKVSVSSYNRSLEWQTSELDAVLQFSHVLVEAERSLFGGLFKWNLLREIEVLHQNNVEIALMCHGTDVRSPRNHLALTEWSPYFEEKELALQHQKEVDRNFRLIQDVRLPTFVSTPDLLLDLPNADWCPVVVDSSKWPRGKIPLQRKKPVVAHIPSMGVVKGTHLIEPVLHALDSQGLIEYRPYKGVPAEKMPSLIQEADIVLDQFRIGSYGVAAVEAMFSGRLVIGHIAPEVRRLVLEHTGLELPIVEANPSTLVEVIQEILQNRTVFQSFAENGYKFAAQVHDGRKSVKALKEKWLKHS